MTDIVDCIGMISNTVSAFVPGSIFYIAIPFTAVYALLKYFRR